MDAYIAMGEHVIEITTREPNDDLVEDVEEAIDLVSERDRVIAWRNWIVSIYHDMRIRVFKMEGEKAFALRWLNTIEMPFATRFTYISKVYGDKLMEEK